MELFQIKINSTGEVEAEKITNKINSIHEAKIFEEGHIAQSNKMIGKVDSLGSSEEAPRNFKKDRNMSANHQNGPLTINLPNSTGYSPQTHNQMLNSPTVPNVPHQIQNPNMLQPTNNKINGTQYSSEPQTPKSPTIVKVGEDHRLVIEGVRLAMDLIDSKLPNHMGYAHLLLTRTLAILSEITIRTSKKEVQEILERETKDIEAERDMINSKMFAYELKGLENWKQYLRGKFF